MSALRELLRDSSSRQLRVAMDVDETLAEVHTVMINNYNSVKGTSYTISDHTSYDYKGIGSNYDEMMVHYSDVWKNQHGDIRLIGNSENVRKLDRYYSVDIVTTRNPDNEGIGGGTVDPLKEWLRIRQLDEVPLVIVAPGRDKADLDYDIYVDDSPGLARSVKGKEGKFLLLPRKPWNSEVERSDRVIPVADVNEAARILLRAARMEMWIDRTTGKGSRWRH